MFDNKRLIAFHLISLYINLQISYNGMVLIYGKVFS
jgi:hypothetical protein